VHSYDLIDDTNKVPLTRNTTLMIKNAPNQLGRHDLLQY
jgi:hypothetical protein